MNDLSERAKQLTHISFGGWVLSLFMILRLPSASDIDPSLLRQPVQDVLEQYEFHFPYHGQDIKVLPVATYEIRGLVVSHNDPSKWYNFDITHDSKSLDTRDVCLIWGSNLQTDDFKKVSFHNSDWMCTWSFGNNVKSFNESEISNNHLITANDAVREKIATLHVGDQIVLKGKLAYYAEERWGARMRQSSLSRVDTGNGACEIIYVESIDVLHSHNWLWVLFNALCFWVCVILITARSTAFLVPRRWIWKAPKLLLALMRRITSIYRP